MKLLVGAFMIRKILPALLFTSCLSGLYAQKTLEVLFLGNSYTHRNKMPELVSAFAKSRGNKLIQTTYAPGGWAFSSHFYDEKSKEHIASKDWNFVVLQGQSQEASRRGAGAFPSAAKLSNLIKQNDSCTQVTFFMTWGRKNGDDMYCRSYPPVCTYEGMDDLINKNYRKMADDNDGIVSPVGAVWRYLRENHNSLELYKADESHPTPEGSFAAACCFYTVFFQDDPTLSSYRSNLSDSVASKIKRAVKRVVYNNLEMWNITDDVVKADFSFEKSFEDSSQYIMKNASVSARTYKWLVNSKVVSRDKQPTFTFDTAGVFNVSLISYGCWGSDTSTATIVVSPPTNLDLRWSRGSSDLSVTFNSATQKVTISGSSTVLCKLYSVSGKLLHEESIHRSSPLDLRAYQQERFVILKAVSPEGVGSKILYLP